MDEFQKALKGEITTEGWDAAKLVDYHKFLTETVDTTKGEVGGLREQKRAETDRIASLKKDVDAEEARLKALKENGGEPPEPENPQMKQFRGEQVTKAKNKLYSEVTLTDEEKAVVEEKFARLDTGKLDAEFIYLDLVSAVAAANPTKYLELTKQSDQAKLDAEAELARQAAAGEAPPSGEERKKFSQEVLDLAKKAGISPEAAKKQVEGGMSRTY